MMPIADAINAITEETADAEQQSLPGIVPPFNYEGAYLELEAKAVEVEHLAAIHAEDAARAKGSRKNWESAASVFSSMALEFRRRRRAKSEPGESADTDADGNLTATIGPEEIATLNALEADGELPLSDSGE